MRGLIFAVFAILAGVRGAVALEPVSVVISGLSSTGTIAGVSIATQSATSVIVSTGAMYRQVCVQNFDTSAFLACSENVGVSTQTANNLVGTIIPAAATASTPASPTCFSVVAGKNFYCLSSSVTASTRAGIGRAR